MVILYINNVQVFITIKELPSLHQYRVITAKHIHTKPYIFVRLNVKNFPKA